MIGLHFQKDHSGSTVENKLATYYSQLCKKWQGPRQKHWQCVWEKENRVYRSLVRKNSGLSRLEARVQVPVITSGIWANTME